MPRLAAFQRRLFMWVASITLVVLSADVAAAHPPEFVYALRQENGGTNQIYGFHIALFGELVPLPGFPVGSGGTGTNVTASEQLTYVNGRLYVINDGSDTLSVFSVNRSTGALTALPFSPIALGAGQWRCVAAHPGGSTVVAGSASDILASFVVTATTASAAPGSPFTASGTRPVSCAFSRNGSFVYTGGEGTNIAGFSVASSGGLTPLPGSPFNSGSVNPRALATDSTGRLFASHFTFAQVRVFTTPTGVPTGVAGNPFLPGVNAVHGVLHPAGFHILVDPNINHVQVQQISGSGAATMLNTVSGAATGGTFSNALTLTHDGVNLVAANGTSRNLTVFRVNANTGALQFLAVQPVNTLGATGLITGVVSVQPPILGDFNGDRHADVLWRNKVTGENVAWLMNGTVLSGAGLLPTIADVNWEVKGVGDFDASSKADVIWRNRVTGQNIVWLMDGLSIALSAFLPAIADTNWEIAGVGDVDANATTDVMWRNKVSGDNVVWLMDGASVSLSAFLPTIADTNWVIGGAGDFDGDGKADLIWRHKATGQNIAWLMHGASVAFFAFLPNAGLVWDIKGAGDLNADGKADVVWRNQITGQYVAWLMNGAAIGSSGSLPQVNNPNWEIKSMRDVDGDHAVDVVWRNGSTGWNAVSLMNGFSVNASAFLSPITNLDWEIIGQ